MADRKLAAHLLRRATFGPTAAEIDAAAARDHGDVVAGLVFPKGADPVAPLPVFAADPYFGRTGMLSREQRAQARRAARDQLTHLAEGWLARMVRADHQLAEKLVFFWHGHWATSAQKVNSATLMAGQLATFRAHGRGDFALLAKAMLRDPALIFWLDGQRNTARGPNENLARELMELFTLGVGAYTEKDVKAAARALTGWTLDRDQGTAVFQPKRHAAGEHAVLDGTARDADSLADLLLRQHAHPVFLASRLWFRFGSGAPLPDATRDRMVAAYGSGRDVSAMLGTLLTDDQFEASGGQLVKQPVEWAVGALRQLGVAPTGKVAATVLNAIRRMGQVPLRPPSVGGWPAGTAWLTTSSLQVRMRAAAALGAALPDATADLLARGDAAARVDAIGRLLAVDAWTGRTRAALTGAAARPQRLVTLALISPEYAVH
ncbi:hypothetical protein Cs7R123_00800 [Catellatospora sp. TT07R-123]|uniref:DUF1800 domain-containing protein n=1 Tax=Catellatospora sp. TT07R-123 TaxID=2733863 RepID=UPI001B0709AE|nr:DUF1800 domain-containing protein [Catellatospora sp. TT07R-123]GHJ42738.1 hypothetical protein Cs7R123_00800 [Catellatospora sp. TT07R-123]